ncbi:MAG TPA: glycosyltransferase family 9 protein [Noviherbaspirillum sp.]|uniref:glycosyltransferase family 9 protein n=1 Tax=Noviherbaspirillum sp. TaxID=1926288 RepID=UPI002D51A04B|nr:glycosyltransferase family 9 protein [Noviherbaspirillum sp.]HYD97118.1 glycosyltransferase family 9 protein [Noviherbaspirillum sp.]
MTSPVPSDIRRIAVLRPNAVGDFMFTLPCLHALKAKWPDAHLVYVGKQWHADFLRGRPGPVDEVAVIPPCPGVGLPPDADVDRDVLDEFMHRMRAARFDLAFQVYGGGLYSNPFIREFGARCTIGLKAPEAAPLDLSVAYGPLQNRRLQMLEVAALAGADTLRLQRELEATDGDRREAESVLPHDPVRPLVVLQPGASDRRRCWPAERYAALGDILAGAGARVAVNGTAQEAAVVREVVARMQRPAVDLSGRLTLSGLCGLLERASLLVSNDTGPLHLGLALGTPCVGIYWLTNLMESAPLRQDGHRPALSLRIHCAVCGEENLKTRCEHDASFVDGVAVDEVAALALDLLRRA